jgi:hypothetical protein
MWTSVLEVLENICDDGESEQRTKASGLIQRMEHFEFVLILHLMIRVLGKTQELSQCLQRKKSEYCPCYWIDWVSIDKYEWHEGKWLGRDICRSGDVLCK